jgi:galactokinase
MPPGKVFRAPARVNLIGEHTDYNDGFVMPAALALSTTVAAASRPDRILAVYSENFGETREFNLDDPAPRATRHWSDYIHGVAVILQQAAVPVGGANLKIHGNVPIGAGLGSSASLEVATALALLDVARIDLPPAQIAQLCRKSENEFVGIHCGIMDQFAACHGTPGEALMLDCRSLEFHGVPLPSGTSLVICNTMVRHELAASAYNHRRAECAAGARHLGAALRDVTLSQLEQHQSDPDPTLYRRCRHVITENTRVAQAFAALEHRALDRFGALMRASHQSLRDDFEVSCPELDLLADLASNLPGVYGSRMTGGGFGGCTVNLVRSQHADAFCDAIQNQYQKITGILPAVYR